MFYLPTLFFLVKKSFKPLYKRFFQLVYFLLIVHVIIFFKSCIEFMELITFILELLLYILQNINF